MAGTGPPPSATTTSQLPSMLRPDSPFSQRVLPCFVTYNPPAHIQPALEEDAPLDLPMYPPIFRQERTLYEMRGELKLKNGLTYHISLDQGTECNVTYTADTNQEDLWNGFLAGSNPYGGDDDPEIVDHNWRTTAFQFPIEHLDLHNLSDAPDEYDWSDDITPANLGDNVKPQVVVNPFDVGKINRFTTNDVRRLLAAPDPQQVHDYTPGAVIFSPPDRSIAAVRRSFKRQGRSMLMSEELPTQLRKPYILQRIAEKGIIVVTSRVEDIHPTSDTM